ncbi:MAG: V-type ATP synthase subunit D [Candidatus Diapherotrites archaeon]|nr:V-type ATP synthase subunit D [Candidatus Diapherotrites archaeon]
MQNLKATRTQMLLLRKKINLARRGHKLLKEKNDVLVMEFFSTLRDLRNIGKELADKFDIACNSLDLAEAIDGTVNLERLSFAGYDVEVNSRKVMGVELLSLDVFKSENFDRDLYSYRDYSLELENSILKFREVMPLFLKLCEKQLALKKIGEEIRKTKRRTNSLEKIIIPKFEKYYDIVDSKLEEIERENFIRLKIVKEKKFEREN